ncbi:hypothetical protein ACN47E_002478 [Coniothyrium glycines]
MARFHTSDEEAPLEDKTAALTLRNKRTERQKRKNATRQQKRDATVALAKLPTELLLETLQHLTARDVFCFGAVNRRFHALVYAHSRIVGEAIIARRYPILAQCFPTPRLLSAVEPGVQALLTDPGRQAQLSIHNRPYQHIQPPDVRQLCTCLTCILTWNNLGLVLDFARWQHSLDTATPLPIVPRGHTAEWNTALVATNASIARRAVDDALCHARILEMHLDSTIRAIRRHAKNKGNKRVHVAMTDDDAASGTDSFLAKHGPLSLEFPYQRDEYYMLEAYLPNRWWRKNERRWVYTIAGQHERDLELVQRLAKRDHLALLNQALASIDADNWMTDVLDFKTYMMSSHTGTSNPNPQKLKYYAAVV